MNIKLSPKEEERLLIEVNEHYTDWTEDVDKRLHRKNGWNDITDAYFGRLPEGDEWPFESRVTDPRIRTTILEKNARLTNGKLRGRFVPREDGDAVGAQINNALIDYQWDNATHGGSMNLKVAQTDLDTRLYGSKFVLVDWRTEWDDSGKLIFDGNEYEPLDIRDCGMDFSASHIRDAKWFQHRAWEFLEDLENSKDRDGKPMYKNLDKIRESIDNKLAQSKRSSQRRNAYVSRVKQLKGLEDRIGTDGAFPVLEVVTERRPDCWITFSPEHNVILRYIKNPYNHGKINVSQLRYYKLDDDAIGESEVEPVLPLWLGIQSVLCAYLDEVILKIRPPLKIIPDMVDIDSIVYGAEAQWLMTGGDINAVQEMRSSGDALAYFQTTYGALVSAFNTAMGDLSQGTSGVDPFSPEKTATEIVATEKQRTTRDQKNQQDLADHIIDVVSMWRENNRQFLFSDPNKKEVVIRIVGKSKWNQLKEARLSEMEVTPEAMQLVADITQQYPDMSNYDIEELMKSVQTPVYPVIENPEEKDPAKYKIKPRMRLSDVGDIAEVSILPEDLNGNYDYIPDVKSMAIGSGEQQARARNQALELLVSNPAMLQLLAEDNVKPDIKELLIANLEESGLRDAQRFFQPRPTPVQPTNPISPNGIPGAVGPNAAVPGAPQAAPISPSVPMAQG